MLYLELFHGREHPAQDMDDWGSQGPVFGPMGYVHTTYGSHIKLDYEPGDIFIIDGLAYYDGVYYGDWSVFPESLLNDELRARIVPFDESKAVEPAKSDKGPLVGDTDYPVEDWRYQVANGDTKLSYCCTAASLVCVLTGAEGENADDCTTHDHKLSDAPPHVTEADMQAIADRAGERIRQDAAKLAQEVRDNIQLPPPLLLDEMFTAAYDAGAWEPDEDNDDPDAVCGCEEYEEKARAARDTIRLTVGNALRDAINLIDCNCSGPCTGTCTYSECIRGLAMIDREPSAVPTGDRGEFYVEVPTLEEGATIGLSATDALSESGPAFRWNALIQVGKGPYTCAYLNDEGLRRFRDAIDSYLSTPNEGGKVIA